MERVDILMDRPSHKGYPGIVYPGRVAFVEWLKEEMLKTYQELYDEALDEMFGMNPFEPIGNIASIETTEDGLFIRGTLNEKGRALYDSGTNAPSGRSIGKTREREDPMGRGW